MLEQGPDFWCWFDTTQFSYHCVHPNTCKDVFNPNVTILKSNCAEGLHFSAFHYSSIIIILIYARGPCSLNDPPEETIAEYVAELRRLAARRSFDGYLSKSLQNRIVCGLSNEATGICSLRATWTCRILSR